jgi:diguanylate cyclase (GGDEF)-like protein/PAS domain S-box-containing protein
MGTMERGRGAPEDPTATARLGRTDGERPCSVADSLRDIEAQSGPARLYAAEHHIRVLAGSRSFYAGLHAIVGALVDAPNFRVVLCDPESGRASVAYVVDEREPAGEAVPQGQHSLTDYVMRTGQSLMATPEVCRLLESTGQVDPVDPPLAAWAGVPVLRDDVTLGALAVKRYAGPRFTPADVGALEAVAATLADVVHHRRMRALVRESQDRFARLAETADCAIFLLQGGEVRYANTPGLALAGCAGDGQVPRWNMVHPADREAVMAQVRERLDGRPGTARGELRVTGAEGTERWLELSTARTSYRGRPAVLGVAFDITDRKEAEEQARTLVGRDPLTGLPNRQLFADRLAVALSEAARARRGVALLSVDLDRFKDVNDSLGHTAGDAVLRQAAARLRALVRSADTVARLGGDEFVVLLKNVEGPEAVAPVAGKVLELMRAPFLAGDRDLFLGASVGISLFPDDATDAESLLRNADNALYRAKDHGRDNYQLYSPALQAQAAERLDLESGLRRALAGNELCVHYQPILDVRTGHLHGLEALVRWRHPRRGLLVPHDFLAVAEATDLMVPLGLWVLRTACAQVREWDAAFGDQLLLAVNLSARQFRQADLGEQVAAVLAETGLAPGRLELEVTESHALPSPEAAARALGALNALGVRVAIDDFGTGYSSLSHLRNLPFQTLKIDQSFVAGLAAGTGDAAIVSAVVALGHSLQVTVLAEGVETREQLDLLAARECDLVQGFYYSPPLSAPDCERFLALHHRSPGGVPRVLPFRPPA